MLPDLHYRIGSVTKTFTADAVLRLVDQGLVALSDPIAMYVDDIPNGDVITIQDLLAMRSGLFDYASDPDFYARYTADPALPWTTEDSLALVRAHAADATAPNTTTEYTNANFVLLGEVIERVTGQTVRRPSHPSDRRARADEHVLPDRRHAARAVRHRLLQRRHDAAPAYRDVTVQNPAVGGAAGAIISTVPDMTQYAIEMGTGAGLTPETFERGRLGPP